MANVRNAYQAGVCNIGLAERRTRRRAGWLGLAITVVLWVLFIIFQTAAPWRLFLFLPAMLGATGFFQAGMSFCVNFGMRGVENFGDAVGTVTEITSAEDRKRDHGRSVQIILYSAATAVVVTAAGVVSGLWA